MASAEALERAHYGLPSFSIINLSFFIFMHKACNDRLPNILSDSIIKKGFSSYSTRARDSVLVPRFSSRYIKDFTAYRGSILWNTVTWQIGLDIATLGIYNDFNFKVIYTYIRVFY